MQPNCAVVLLLTLVLQRIVLELQAGRERKKDERVRDGSRGYVPSNLPRGVCTQSAPAMAPQVQELPALPRECNALSPPTAQWMLWPRPRHPPGSSA